MPLVKYHISGRTLETKLTNFNLLKNIIAKINTGSPKERIKYVSI